MTDSAHPWTLTDGNAGNVRQALALARALELGTPREWVLRPHAPWRWAAPRRWPGAGRAFGEAFAAGLRAAPALAIGCGRQAALATRLLRAHGSRVVQILDPRIDPAHWDVVIAPEHDGLQGANVVTLSGSLNPVDDAWLAEARARFADFATLPAPRTALLLGGPSAHYAFDGAALERLCAQVDRMVSQQNGSLLATCSRRTPSQAVQALRARYAHAPHVRLWCGEQDGPNPYAGFLAWADRIVCTPDSVNMLSEACATRAPVHVFEPARLDGRPRRFLDSLIQRGRVRGLDDGPAATDVEPLRETARVARIVRERLRL